MPKKKASKSATVWFYSLQMFVLKATFKPNCNRKSHTLSTKQENSFSGKQTLHCIWVRCLLVSNKSSWVAKKCRRCKISFTILNSI